jgi:hypothetical protein
MSDSEDDKPLVARVAAKSNAGVKQAVKKESSSDDEVPLLQRAKAKGAAVTSPYETLFRPCIDVFAFFVGLISCLTSCRYLNSYCKQPKTQGEYNTGFLASLIAGIGPWCTNLQSLALGNLNVLSRSLQRLPYLQRRRGVNPHSPRIQQEQHPRNQKKRRKFMHYQARRRIRLKRYAGKAPWQLCIFELSDSIMLSGTCP